MSKLLSIVTPSFNQAQYIEQTIDSVLTGKPDNVEYIIVDGNSTDGSKEIISKYDKYLDYFISEDDCGQSDAIIKGFRVACGQWFNWLNSDDYLVSNVLNTLVIELSSQPEDSCIVSGNTNIVDNQGRSNGILIAKNANTVSDILLAKSQFVAPQPSTFIKSKVFWLRRNLHYIMDWALYLEILDVYPGSMNTLDLDISNFRDHQESKTNSFPHRFSSEAMHFLSQKRFFSPANNIARISYLREMKKMEISRKIQDSHSPVQSILSTLRQDPSLLFDRIILSAFSKSLFSKRG